MGLIAGATAAVGPTVGAVPGGAIFAAGCIGAEAGIPSREVGDIAERGEMVEARVTAANAVADAGVRAEAGADAGLLAEAGADGGVLAEAGADAGVEAEAGPDAGATALDSPGAADAAVTGPAPTFNARGLNDGPKAGATAEYLVVLVRSCVPGKWPAAAMR